MADGRVAPAASVESDASSASQVPTSYPDAGRAPSGSNERYGSVFSGGEFHLGPVDWEETQFHNACASEQKYPGSVRRAEGQLLAGIWSGVSTPESYCDTCIEVQTAKGKTAVLRVVTYGDTTVDSIDVSSEAYALLDSGEYPRNMSWQLVGCPDTGKLSYEFKTGSNAYWTAFWVRNARVPIASVEVMSLRHAYAASSRDSDGSFVDAAGFGEGTFSIRVTSVDGQVITDTLTQPVSGLAGALIGSRTNFQ
ncbi:MAG: extracellular endoglucanase precursor [Myxococcaceae bacterium]|nr:extracellular endoglucanase precursor [Myxococcaceae bacterium]